MERLLDWATGEKLIGVVQGCERGFIDLSGRVGLELVVKGMFGNGVRVVMECWRFKGRRQCIGWVGSQKMVYNYLICCMKMGKKIRDAAGKVGEGGNSFGDI